LLIDVGNHSRWSNHRSWSRCLLPR